MGGATLGRVAGAEGWRRVRIGRVPGFGALCASDFSVTCDTGSLWFNVHPRRRRRRPPLLRLLRESERVRERERAQLAKAAATLSLSPPVYRPIQSISLVFAENSTRRRAAKSRMVQGRMRRRPGIRL